MKLKKIALTIASLSAITASPALLAAETLAEAFSEGTVKGNFNLRYETVDQDNALRDANGLTLRSRLTYQSGSYHNFSTVIEFEDSRTVLGVDDFNDTNGKNAGLRSVIADPETTELDQGYLQYKSGAFTAKLGRQVITFDGHRFVGHVGWRQDRQTFDAASLNYKKDDVTFTYAYVDKRNRIFGEEKDLDSKDHLLNASYKTKTGKLVGYAYLLEVDNNTDNSLDTYGFSYNGKASGVKYKLEYATQDADAGANSFSADYLNAELGTSYNKVNFTLGYELLGSDNGQYGFSTPLATLHKFNGFADLFLATPDEGLVDIYATVSGKAFGGKWVATYHDFSADDSSPAVDDLGDEINLLYVRPIDKTFTFGAKYASYSAGDTSGGRVDTDKLWLWLNAKF